MFEKKKYDQEFVRNNYDRLNIQVKKGMKAKIDEHRKAKGYNSLNEYVNDLIRRDMNEGGNKGISVGDISQNGVGNSINIG